MPNINDAFPSKYLKASDLKGSEPIVAIDRVDFEPVGRDREMKAVLYFQGKEKGLVLNKTNANKVTQLSGSAITEDWQGFRVKLFATETEFGGDTVECIRIKVAPVVATTRPSKPAPPPAPAVEDFDHSAPVEADEIPF